MTPSTHERELPAQLDRLRLLVAAGIALSSEHSLDALLQKIVETAAELTDARYAALGVVERSGRSLERFFTVGIDEETRARIGAPPRGHGLLGAVIRSTEPIRLREIGEHPASSGFPPHHPEMHTFLGVPILLRGRVYGDLYLADKRGGEEFTEADEELTTLLASQAAVAIENARLYESLTRSLDQLESLQEIGNALASQVELEPVLTIVAERLRALVDARLVLIALLEPDGALRIAAAEGEGGEALLDTRLARERSKAGRVLERRRSERVNAVEEDPEVDEEAVRRLGVRTALYAPLLVGDRPLGVLVAHDKQRGDGRFDEEDLRLAESLAQRAAIAVDLSQRVSRDAVRRVVAGQELERARLARELHDETGQALTSILLGLKTLEQSLDSEEARHAAADVRELVVDTLQRVRRLAVELRPAALDDFGLAPALERLVETYRTQSEIDCDLELRLRASRLPPEVETTLYRIVQEALTNVAKHARAERVSVLVRDTGSVVVVVVEDDGVGFDAEAPVSGLGLAGMRERLALVGGRLRLETAPSRGTTLAAEVPLR
ncbi:MAG: GAF domain-containing sensor histidine kinase [Gaiellaceae bacterium]|nr:GAF domain-containing sensor histidine kinase [Gaiellaceae bacterium]